MAQMFWGLLEQAGMCATRCTGEQRLEGKGKQAPIVAPTTASAIIAGGCDVCLQREYICAKCDQLLCVKCDSEPKLVTGYGEMCRRCASQVQAGTSTKHANNSSNPDDTSSVSSTPSAISTTGGGAGGGVGGGGGGAFDLLRQQNRFSGQGSNLDPSSRDLKFTPEAARIAAAAVASMPRAPETIGAGSSGPGGEAGPSVVGEEDKKKKKKGGVRFNEEELEKEKPAPSAKFKSTKKAAMEASTSLSAVLASLPHEKSALSNPMTNEECTALFSILEMAVEDRIIPDKYEDQIFDLICESNTNIILTYRRTKWDPKHTELLQVFMTEVRKSQGDARAADMNALKGGSSARAPPEKKKGLMARFRK